jgi:hypothetical protein
MTAVRKAPPMRPHQLALDPLTDTTWRLCDRSFASCDADNVVAYIEALPDGGYEAVWVSHGGGVAVFASLDELMQRAVEIVAPQRPRGPVKPIPIAHRPPPLAAT